MDDSMNKIMANLMFGTLDANAQLNALETKVGQSSARMQAMFNKMGTPSTTNLASQQAKSLWIVQDGVTKNIALNTKGEQQINAIHAKGAKTRIATAQQEARTRLLIAQEEMAKEKLLYMQSRRTAFDAKPTGMAGLMERRASWMLTGGAIFGGIAAGGEVISTITEVESGMTQIARITEDVNFNFNEMRDDIMQLGVDFGQTFDITSDIATRWAQAGYNVKDTLTLTKDALLALNTAELDAQYATQGFIAIMAQWDIEAENLLPVIDKINITADNFAITSQDLVDGLNRSGQAAKNAGLNIEQTIGAITVLREASGRTGKEVGTAFRTILSYMTRQKTVNLMESLGIQVFEDEAKTTFRNVMNLMEELSAKWQNPSTSRATMVQLETDMMEQMNEELAIAIGLGDEWNDVQERDLSQAAAGVRRRNFFLSLMSRFGRIQEVVNGQLDAEGYSLAENERTMGTLEKQTIALKAACEALAVAIGDAGLLDDLKGLVDGVTDAVQWFNNLDGTMQTTLITFAEMTVAVKLLDIALKAAGFSALLSGGGATASGLAAILPRLKTAASGITSIAGAATLAGTAVKGLGKGVAGLVGGPVGIALIGVSTAFGVIHKEAKKANKELEESSQTAKRAVSQYDALVAAGEDTARLEREIAQALPQLITGWNEETGAIELNMDALRDLAELADATKTDMEEEAGILGDLADVSKETSIAAIEAQIANTTSAKDNAIARMKILGEEIAALQAFHNAQAEWEPAIYKGKYNPLRWIRDFSAEVTGYGKNDLARKQEELAQQQFNLEETENAIDAAQKRIDEIRAGGGGDGGGGNDHDDTPTPSGSSPDYADWFEDYVRALSDYLPTADEAIFDHANMLDILGSKEQLIQNALGDMIPSFEQQALVYRNLNEQMQQHKEIQGGLHTTANQYRDEVDILNRMIEQEDAKLASGTITVDKHAESTKVLIEEKEKLEKIVKDMSAEWWQEEVAISDLKQTVDEFMNDTLEKLIEKMREVEIAAIESAKEAYEAASNAKIEGLEKRLELLDRVNKEEERSNSIAEARAKIEEAKLDLQEAQEKLTNVEAEKNTRIFKDGAWEYIADPQAIKQAQDGVEDANQRLIDAKTAYHDTINRIEEEQYKESLRRQIEHEKEVQKEKLASFDKQKKDAEAHYKDELEEVQTKNADLVSEEETFMTNFNTALRGGLSEARGQWDSYYARVQAIMAETGLTSGEVLASYDIGGPIPKDGPIYAHGGEYMLTKSDVSALGGIAGVEQMRVAIRTPNVEFNPPVSRVSNTSNTTTTHKTVDKGIVIQNAHFPHVVDGSGMIRNLNQMAQS